MSKFDKCVYLKIIYYGQIDLLTRDFGDRLLILTFDSRFLPRLPEEIPTPVARHFPLAR